MYCSIKDPKPHQMMTCPYNKAHQVEHYRMHIHLQKCRKQYPNSAKTTCPINATHVVNVAELDFHVSTCPDRFLFDSQKYIVEDEVAPREMPAIPVVECEENWEDEQASAYVPNSASKAHIITKGLLYVSRRDGDSIECLVVRGRVERTRGCVEDHPCDGQTR